MFHLAQGFLDANYPQHEWRTRFGIFACGPGRPSPKVCRAHIEKFAEKQGVAQDLAHGQFVHAVVRVDTLFERLGDARLAWAAYLDESRRKGQKLWAASVSALMPLVLNYLGILDGSSDVERIFARMELTECKRAVGHHRPSALSDVLKVALDGPRTKEALLRTAARPRKHRCDGGTHVVESAWNCRSFVVDCQKKYAEFFGTRKLKSRSLDAVPLTTKARMLASIRPRLSGPSPKSKKSKNLGRMSRRRDWEASVAALTIESAAAGRRPQAKARKTLLDVSAAPEPDVARAQAYIHKRKATDAALHAAQEGAFGLAAPIKPIRAMNVITLDQAKAETQKAKAKAKAHRKAKVKASLKAKAPAQGKACNAQLNKKNISEAKDTGMAPPLVLPEPNLAPIVWDLAGREFDDALQSVQSLEARLYGRMVQSKPVGGRTEQMQFLAAGPRPRVLMSPAAQAQYPKSVEVLRRAGLLLLQTEATSPARPGHVVRLIGSGRRDPDAPRLAATLGGVEVWSLTQLTRSVGVP